jgi:hypothetical protein
MKAPRQEVQLMAFAGIETRAPNPEAWLVHPFLWLQPELALGPVPPAALRPERRQDIPVPQFAPLVTTVPSSAGKLMWGAPPVTHATSTSRPPASDLEPLRALL